MLGQLVLLIALVSFVHGALNNCPAPNPCVCEGSTINCNSKALYMVPTFKPAQGRHLILKLSNNSITTIPNNAFASLNVSIIELDNNRISLIDDGAFSGNTAELKRLNLAHNHLTKLPQAIAYLEKLQDLDVTWNPIDQYKHHHSPDGLTDSVMRAIGDSVTKFAFGDSSFTTWPKPLTHLNQLQELTVSGSNLTYWPATCFHGFEHTLTKLTINYAAIASIPIGISSLTKIKELHLDHLAVRGIYGQIPFGDDSMISAPFQPIAGTLEILSLKYDGLTEFPEVIKDLAKLNNLSLDGNNLEFISDEAISLLINANVTTLSLKDCNLKRVPGAISDVRNLLDLDLSQNHVRSIESTDLQHLTHLKKLSLSENPLKYLSNDSLCGMNKLEELNLESTSLTELSQSFKNLQNLHTLNLKGSKIDCTCDITWLSLWKTRCPKITTADCKKAGLQISGQCETIDESIMEYICDRLPSCLDYTADLAKFQCHADC